MRNKLSLLLIFTVTMVLFFACSKSSDKNPDENLVNGFDKTAMLTYYADSIIVPNYKSMQQKLSTLKTTADAFIATPSINTQADLKEAYKQAHLQYERIAAFQFGPAESRLLDLYVNFSGGLDYSFSTSGELTGFSIDTTTIENNIVSGTYDLAAMTRNSFYSQGFPAMNYLFFAPDAINRLTSNNTPRGKYIDDVINRFQNILDAVTSDWSAYRQDFISNTKTNVGSPIGSMVNQLAYQLDLLKGPRIGWPYGKQSGGLVFATKCEAYYAGISVALAVENLNTLKNVYTGVNSGKGLSNYLIALGNATLNTEVAAQFDAALAALQAIPDPLSQSLTSESVKVDAAYKEVQKLLTLMKTDVASATAVQITFMDNDGD